MPDTPQKQSWDRLALPLLLIGGLLLRFGGLPLAQVANADAVSRVFITIENFDNLSVFFRSSWGMLHFFLIAGALKVRFDPIYSPIVLHILISVSTAIPLYFFVRREWGQTAARYVTAASLLYPVAFRHSYLPLTEVPFVFFAVCSLNFISLSRNSSRLCFVVLAGLAHLLATALRMEAWLLIPFYALLLRSNPKHAFIFIGVACIYPGISMIQNYLTYGDPIPWVTKLRTWVIIASGANEGLTVWTVIRRLIFFPSALFFGLTPLLFLVCLAGAVITIKKRKPQREFLLPLLGLLCIFPIQAARGLAVLDLRFSLILGYLALPFAGEIVKRFSADKRFLPLAMIILLSMIPFSYSRVVLARVAGPEFPNPFPGDMEIIPRAGRHAVAVAKLIPDQIQSSDEGLIIDFFNWKDTRYVALMSRLHPKQIWFLPGARHERLNLTDFSAFLRGHPNGVLVRFDHSQRIEQNTTESFTLDQTVTVKAVFLTKIQNLTLYRYSLSQD